MEMGSIIYLFFNRNLLLNLLLNINYLMPFYYYINLLINLTHSIIYEIRA